MSSSASTTSTGRPARPAGRGRRKRLTFDRVSFFAVFLGVPLVIFLVFVVSPFVQAIYYSLTDWNGFSATMNFVGAGNFVKLFQDDTFLLSLRNSVILGLVVPFVTIVLALALACVVTIGGSGTGAVRGLRRSSLYRVVSFFPYAVPAVVIGIIWAQIYDPSRGILNAVLTSLGFQRAENYPWLGDSRTAMAATIFVIVWSFVGFYMVLFIAGIRGIDPEIFESARLDGASRVRTAWSLVVPLIRDNVQTAYIYLGIASLDSFVYMAAMNPDGGPQNSTLVMSQDLYITAFTKGQFGYATSMGVMLAVVTLVFAALVFIINGVTGGRDKEGRR
ncbi:carbohydrate ABC transporter permease [Actinocatenispora rupis]|uniref:Sugar ABC transporter permease n=1 Tax=Actinocatenispora rupis TaxID=519421 RepID=A0A8J3NEV5_9ACTN|nr:sugar ABC transporter permease [Actinocatenispora rupis]GID13019.1 sugar ABC transporter permease [Actinocatenispora rupis]